MAKRSIQASYNRDEVKSGIVHMSLGNFHRAHMAVYTDEAIAAGDKNWGITAVGLLPHDADMCQTLKSQSGVYSVLSLQDDKQQTKVVSSIVDVIHGPAEHQKVVDKIAANDTKIVSLTVTEKGYYYTQAGDLDFDHAAIRNDLLADASQVPQTFYEYLCRGLLKRQSANMVGVTILCCDNLIQNGDLTKRLFLAYVAKRCADLLPYINQKCTFPNSMVDRITPVVTPDKKLWAQERLAYDDQAPIICEEFRQWVIEDNFAAGRPAWENFGAQFVSNVHDYEIMKVRLLNGSHSALSYISILLGYADVDDAMHDVGIKQFIKNYMMVDIAPTLNMPHDIDLNWYVDSLLERFGNRAIKDQLLRLAMDGSRKIPNAIIPALYKNLENGHVPKYIMIALACWVKFLSKTSHNLEVIDPISEKLHAAASLAYENPIYFTGLKEIFLDNGLKMDIINSELSALLVKIDSEGVRSLIN